MAAFAVFSFLSVFLVAQPNEVRPYRLSGLAQGTAYHITYYATDSIFTSRQADSVFRSLDSSLSLYQTYSVISAFNRSASGMVIDEHLRHVVARALEVEQATGGAFDITVWPLVNAWGFGLEKTGKLPDSAAIRALLRCTGSARINLNGNVLRKQQACVQLDVNGIAQGYSVDVMARLLEEKGIQCYIVEVGGEIRVKGRKPRNEKISIGIEGPAASPFEAAPVSNIIYPGSGAITTSGSYRKFYESNGRRISHLIDPRTGYTVANELVSVTVFAADAMTADAYDNAFMVMGLQRALDFLRRQQSMEAYFIYSDQQGNVRDTATAGFYRLMQN